MLFSTFASVVALSTAVYASPQDAQARKGGNGGNAAANGLTLLANAVQKGSFVDGSKQIGAAEVGQVKSATSKNNFINFCSGKKLTNGLQVVEGSCNGIVMGEIPAKTNMISSVIINPPTGGDPLPAGQTFDIEVQVSNLEPGFFTNAASTYYSAPQALKNGNVVGHTHVTVQDLGNSLNPTKPLPPQAFAFFKGINDAGNGKGLLKATVTGGLPAGNYRVCTMTSASNHQPVLMPVAQRGTPDDCTKFKIGGKAAAGTPTAGNGNAGKGGNGAKGASSSTSAAPAKQSSAASKGGNGGKGRQRPKRVFVV